MILSVLKIVKESFVENGPYCFEPLRGKTYNNEVLWEYGFKLRVLKGDFC